MGARALLLFAQRLGPYLGRLFKNKPALLASLLAKLRTAGAVVGNTAGSIVDWVKTNPTNAVLLASTMATMGYSLAELFEKDDGETADFARSIEQLAAMHTVSDGMILSAGASSQTLALPAMDMKAQANVDMSRHVLKFATGFFGGPANAKLAHKYMQAFFEMSRNDVDFGFQNYNLDGIRLTA